MIKLKSKEELWNSALLVCAVFDCEEEATHLFATESNMIDVCEPHRSQLLAQAFIS
jgi:hypothetical protein